MRVMVIMKASKESEAGVMPSEKMMSDMMQFNEQLVNAGIMKAGEGLHPTSKGVRIRFSGNAEPQVVRGPFSAPPEEIIAGFWLWEVKSMDEAIEWAKRTPNTDGAHTVIEIRKLFEADDFGDNFTPELQEKEAKLRAKTNG